MAGQNLKDLIAAYRDRDDLLFRRAAQGIIQEEEAKKHITLARELRQMLVINSTPLFSKNHQFRSRRGTVTAAVRWQPSDTPSATSMKWFSTPT